MYQNIIQYNKYNLHTLNPIFKLNPSWILLHEYHKISILGINTFLTMDVQLQLLEYINTYFSPQTLTRMSLNTNKYNLHITALGIHQHLLFTSNTHEYNLLILTNLSWILLHKYHKVSIPRTNTLLIMNIQLQFLEYINTYFSLSKPYTKISLLTLPNP